MECKEGDEVWDVVMPLNPTRVGNRQPLNRYLAEVKAATERGVKYRLIVMASQTEDGEVQRAFDEFRDEMGIELYVIDRLKFPDNLRGNFSLYPRMVACEAERGDDATILRGQRLWNQSEYVRLKRKLDDIRGYASAYEPEAK